MPRTEEDITSEIAALQQQAGEFLRNQLTGAPAEHPAWKAYAAMQERLLVLEKQLEELLKQKTAEAAQAAASTEGAPGVAFERFVRFLEPPVDQDVIDRVVIHFATSMLAVGTEQQARQLYNRAAALPGSSTKLHAQQQNGLSIGDFLPNVATKSSLVYAFLHNKPMLLKVPASDDAAVHEANVWAALAQQGHPSNLAGPIELYELRGSGRTRQGILMPLYPVTLQHRPRPMPESSALQVGKDVLAALKHMHQLEWAHCDIKAPNVFTDAAGVAHLGDFGATRKFGADADEKTASHVPVDADGKLNVDKASAALDKVLLAVTLMERVGWLQLGKMQLTMSMVTDGISKATPASPLREFLLGLLP